MNSVSYLYYSWKKQKFNFCDHYKNIIFNRYYSHYHLINVFFWINKMAQSIVNERIISWNISLRSWSLGYVSSNRSLHRIAIWSLNSRRDRRGSPHLGRKLEAQGYGGAWKGSRLERRRSRKLQSSLFRVGPTVRRRTARFMLPRFIPFGPFTGETACTNRRIR